LPTLEKQLSKAERSILGKYVWFVTSCKNKLFSFKRILCRSKYVFADEKNTTFKVLSFWNRLRQSTLSLTDDSPSTA
jgi:hypothetical protein